MKPRWIILILAVIIGALLLIIYFQAGDSTRTSMSDKEGISNRGGASGKSRSRVQDDAQRVGMSGNIPETIPASDGGKASNSKTDSLRPEESKNEGAVVQEDKSQSMPGEGIAIQPVILAGTRIESDFVKLPGGKIRIGSPPDEVGRDSDEGSVREVELKPFWIGKREVTWGEFQIYYRSPKDAMVDGCTHPTAGREYLGHVGVPGHFEDPRRPVICLRWHSAMGYCCYVSHKTGQLIRLPTEAEWEYACRAGSEKPATEDLVEQAWFKDNSQDQTHEVGEKKANAFGLYDMLGNVWEYCLEPYAPPEFGPVLRGGAWNCPRVELRAANRQAIKKEWFDQDPNRPRSVWWLTGDYSQGFRLVLVADSKDLAERQAYAGKIKITVRGQMEHLVKLGNSVEFFMRISGDAKNEGDKELDELHVMLYYLTPQRKPHLVDVQGVGNPGRATHTYVFPVLVNSVYGGQHRQPMKPGESRSFVADIPQTYDGPGDVLDDGFGGRAIGVVFSRN